MTDSQSIAHLLLPRRDRHAHKGDFGVVLGVGGSRGMSGAISLCGRAALRAGAGLVRLAVPDRCLETVAAYAPEYTTIPLPNDDAGRLITAAFPSIAAEAARCDVVAVGPGLGRSDELTMLVASLFRSLAVPMVVDADALFALATDRAALCHRENPESIRILTPHHGEFQRLLRIAREESPLHHAAVKFATQHKVILVLKGGETLVTDGARSWLNTAHGNPGMATGGAGDCLTGIIAALLAQHRDLPDAAFDAACLGVTLHAIAGDCAAAALGEESLIASDLIAFLPQAFATLRNNTTTTQSHQ